MVKVRPFSGKPAHLDNLEQLSRPAKFRLEHLNNGTPCCGDRVNLGRAQSDSRVPRGKCQAEVLDSFKVVFVVAATIASLWLRLSIVKALSFSNAAASVSPFHPYISHV